MRSVITTIVAALLVATTALSAMAQQPTLTGRVVDNNQQPITYATVALTQSNRLVKGCTTDAEGGFAMQAGVGDYELVISFIGYENHKQPIALSNDINLGDIALVPTSEQIDEVVVTAQLIRREADRFVVDVANSPLAMGKDGEELLKSSPGVWIQDDNISIKGSSGSKIYRNDR